MLDFTFEKANLKIVNFSWTLDEDSRLYFYLEISSSDAKGNQNFSVKLNLYDSNGEIIDQDCDSVFNFSGYDTLKFRFYDKPIILRACKARLFIV